MLNRRQFLLEVTGGLMLVGLGPLSGCSQRTRRSSFLLNRTETWANSICQLCPSGCGLRVRLINGHPVTVSGNPLHPINRGGLCARGAASLQLYYDPDRLAGPARRDRSLIGGWAPISRQDALGEVVSRVQQSLANGPGRMAVIRDDGQDVASQLFGRLVRAAGSDWVVDMQTPGERAAQEVLRQMHGTGGQFVYDLAASSFLLSLDSGLLEPSARTMSLQRDFAEMRSAHGYFVHAGPRLGVTGAKADAWLPIRPSTAGFLALGVAHMLIKEGYARAEFLSEHAAGFDDWVDEAEVQHTGVRSWILSEFAPQRVAELTGVGWDQIIRVARQFGSSRRPLAIGPLDGVGSSPTFDAMAVHTLNVIAGAIDVPGGVLLSRSAPFDALDDASRLQTGSGRADGPPPTVEELAAWVLESREPPIDVCFIHDADPVFASVEGDKIAEALRKIPFVVSTSPVLTDTVESVDLVLPDSVWLERGCDSATVDGSARPLFSFSSRAAEPRADSLNPADMIISMAKSVGGRMAEQFPWRDYDDAIKDRIETILSSNSGDTFSEEHRATWAQLLERSGWRTASYKTVEELQTEMRNRGGWWDPVYYHGEWRRLVPRGDHRINLQAVQFPVKSRILGEAEITTGDDLVLYLYAELALTTRVSGSLPYLQDIGSPLSQTGWVTSAEINPATADRLGLVDGDSVQVKNDRGEITARVRLSRGIRPDVVAVHTGGGRVHGGRYSQGVGANPLRLVAAGSEGDARRLRGAPSVVRIERRA